MSLVPWECSTLGFRGAESESWSECEGGAGTGGSKLPCQVCVLPSEASAAQHLQRTGSGISEAPQSWRRVGVWVRWAVVAAASPAAALQETRSDGGPTRGHEGCAATLNLES